MALGHEWTPIVRVTPPAGAAYTVTLSSLLWMTICQPHWEPLHAVADMGVLGSRLIARLGAVVP